VTHAAPAAPPSLPADVAALRALVLATMAERDVLAEERDALASQNDRLRHLLVKLQRLQFGRKSERLPEEQLHLGLEDLETAIAEGDARAEQRDPDLRRERTAKRRANRGALPAHLPRIEVVLEPRDLACPCCRTAMVVIGEDRSERLDVTPAQVRVLVTRRPKLACRACAGVVVQTPAPPRLIAGGLPTEALVAHVLVARYADHLPLYRQAQMLARHGVALDRATLAFQVGYAAAEIAPLVRRLREIVLASVRVFADEIVVPVLDPGRGRTKHGYFWAVARDDRPERHRSAGGGLSLRPWPRDRACPRAARRLPGHPAVRRLFRLQERGRSHWRTRAARAGVLLEPCPARVLRPGQDRGGADRDRGAGAHRRAVSDRGGPPWPSGRRAPRRTPGTEPTVGDRVARLVHGPDGEAADTEPDRRGDPLCAEPLARAVAVPRRRPDRDRQQQCRAGHAPDRAEPELCTATDYAQSGAEMQDFSTWTVVPDCA